MRITRAIRMGAGFTLLLILAVVFALGQEAEKKSEKKTGEPAPLAGCEAKEIRSGTEKGKQERFFAAPLPKVNEALKGALEALEFEVKKESGNQIEAHRRRHVGVFVGSGGEKVVLQLAEAEENGKKGTRVSGETKKGFVGRAGQKSWTNAVLDQTSCILDKSTT